MQLFTAVLMIVSSLVGVTVVFNAHAQQSGSFTGTVEQVWEDGLRLNTGNRILQIDAWDLCADSTASHISSGDRLIVTGEFDGGEFDAWSITDSDGAGVCRQLKSASN